MSTDHSGPYHTQWDPKSEETICETVVLAVAAVSNTDLTALAPLYDVVDPDAVNSLVTSFREAGGGSLRFTYAGFEVVIRDSGRITLQPEQGAWDRSRGGAGDAGASDA